METKMTKDAVVSEKRFLDDLRKYGEVSDVSDDASEDSKIYIFKCDVKKVSKSSVLKKLLDIPMIVHVKNNNTATMYIFYIYEKGQYSAGVIEIVNKVNSELDFGKFYVDDDGDVDWSSTINLKSYAQGDIKLHLKSMIVGLIKLIMMVYDDEQK